MSVFPPEVSAGVSSPDGGLEESSVPSSSIAMGEHPERMLIRIIIRQLFVFICMVMDYGLEGSFAAGEGQVVNVALPCHLDGAGQCLEDSFNFMVFVMSSCLDVEINGSMVG